MSKPRKYKDFDAFAVALKDSNLIEASAGTGKTYSIAILLLRLVLEKKIPVKEILMVTFTKAAVAELEERIRLFIRTAYKASIGEPVADDNISQLVKRAIKASGAEEVQLLLKDAVLLLDETAVLTIHSFCQQTLNEFALETSQLFGAEIVQDTSTIIKDEVNKFWRKHVTTIDAPLLEKLLKNGLRRENIEALVKDELSGKKYFGNDEASDYTMDSESHASRLKEIETAEQKEAELRDALLRYVEDNRAEIERYSESNAYARKNTIPLLDDPAAFLDFLWTKKDLVNIVKVYGELLSKIAACEDEAEKRAGILQNILCGLHFQAIKEVKAGVNVFKRINNLLGYDDMIGNLHKALVERDNPALIAALQKKYKAVFIDEFQDTDRMQYEIFQKAFDNNTILFYIGDPKQSIYAWRKADIFTYFNARNNVKTRYSMNQNYRSSVPLISAMNLFFKPKEDFDTFYFEGEENSIDYIDVDSPPDNKKGFLYEGGELSVPVSVFLLPKAEELVAAAGAQVAMLLKEDAYSIGEKDERRPVRPSDIGILVRTRQQGRDIKYELARLGIPAVTIDDSKVLQTAEANYLLYLMEAMAEPDRSSINKALFSPFTGLTRENILMLNDETALSLFGKYNSRWQKDGIYTALVDFIADFEVRNVLLQRNTENGERIIANLFQLTELVHQVQSRKNLSMTELISWLKRGIDGMETEGDQYEQRVESDDEAVKIVTIHKSKGLEYKIVLTPFLDFMDNSRAGLLSFRDPDTGDYISIEKNRMSDAQLQWYKRQAEQENRRLLYVAITRAVYKCFIFRNNYYRATTLAAFLNALTTSENLLIRIEDTLPVVPEYKYQGRQSSVVLTPLFPSKFILQQQNWRKLSYTMLAAKLELAPRPLPVQQKDPYEQFIFHTLRRGAKTGNMLHFIFENIHFSDDSHWDKVLERAINRYLPGQQKPYLPLLRQLLDQVLNTTITIDGSTFQLASVSYEKRIPEFEFDFPVQLFQPDILNNLSETKASLSVKRFADLGHAELEGIMNGKMDLFFEHGGKYYILDWKSNYLGNTIEEYVPVSLAGAMNESNYHLQYLIYTVAAKKYLESRIPGFDYETQFGGVIYLFVRGIRKGNSTGIFTVKPSGDKIRELENVLVQKVAL